MKCPMCSHPDCKSMVVDSRPASDGGVIRRRRECIHCGKRFTTYETVESLPLIVVKRDRTRETFDRNSNYLKAIRFAERHVRAMGRVSHGVKSMNLAEDDRVTDLCVIEDNCLVTEGGCENLSVNIPRTIEEIEAVMRK